MVNKKKPLSSKTNESYTRTNMKKVITCWNCHLNGRSILDEFGCCKRCGTNLQKYPTRDSHPYPDLDDKKLSQEVLGVREKCDITGDVPFEGDVDPSKLLIRRNRLQEWVHFTDKDGNLRHKRYDPLCYKCGKIATHLLARRNKKNGTKLYMCNDCYNNLETVEWEEDW